MLPSLTWTPKGAITETYDARREIPRDYNTRVNYEVYVPLDYWKEGAEVIPIDTAARVNQLKVYQRLYDGDYDAYFQDPLDAQIDMHFLFADRLVNFLWQYPPELNFDWSDMVSDRFVQTLNRELKNSVMDLSIFGTGLVNVVNGRYGVEVQSPKPIYFYPASELEDAFVVPAPEDDKDVPHVVYKHGANGEWSRSEYENDGGKLGKLIKTDSEVFGSPQAWDVIGMNTLGRPSPMLNFSLEPNTGDWGQSLYFTATSPALEALRRFNGNSAILTSHGNPREVYIPSDRPGDTARKQGERRDQSKALQEVRYELNQLETQRRSPVQILGRQYERIDLLQWMGDLRDHFEQLNFALTMAFGMAYIPLSLVNLDGELRVGNLSGRALRFLYASANTRINNLQDIVKPNIKRAFLVAATMNGASADAVQSFADRIVIDWPNIFDKLDEGAETMVMGESIVEQEREGQPEEGSDGVLPSG